MRLRKLTDETGAAFAEAKSDYAAMVPSRFVRDRERLFGSADAHYFNTYEYCRMREYARDMDRNDPVISALLDRVVQNTIQLGIQPEPQTGDEKLDDDLRESWREWADDPAQCDAAGEMTFWEIEQLVYRQMHVDGDICVLPREDGSLQVIEGDRLQTPGNTKRNCVQGVLLDNNRRRLEYWFSKDPGQAHVMRVADMNRYPAKDADGNPLVYHIYSPHRVTQTRGVTSLAPCFVLASNFDDLNFAKLIQAQMVSNVAAFLESDAGTVQGNAFALGQPELGQTAAASNRNGFSVQSVSPGAIVPLPPGQRISAFSPNVPNSEYFQHVKLLLTIIGTNLGIPLCLVLMNTGDENFSGYRGSVDQARMGFRSNQKALATKLHTPTYRFRVRCSIENRRVQTSNRKLLANIYRHRIQYPGWAYIDPTKDVQGDISRLQNLLGSPRQIHGERGRQFTTIVDETVNDYGYAIRQAIKEAQAIKREMGVDVGWRECINLQMPPGFRIMGDPRIVGEGAGDSTPGNDDDSGKSPPKTPEKRLPAPANATDEEDD